MLDGKLYSKDGENYVKVTASDPQTFEVRVIKLVEKKIPVVVFGENSVELTPEKIEPKEVLAMIVEGDRAVRAEVYLKDDDQKRQAMQGEMIDVEARVVLHQSRVDVYPVKLTLQPEASKTKNIPNPVLYVNIPQAMAEKYVVVLEDKTLKDEYDPITCSGDPKAIHEYDNMGAKGQGHLILDVMDSDEGKESVSRPLRYNLPVGIGEIKVVNQKTTSIRFRLKKIEKAVEVPVK
ncbi:MAG: hypothetical protein GY799_06575 [Desulfobulbaceae bacterium]|nr:hypothetical protein [Desulfobulbaceae bacterium]